MGIVYYSRYLVYFEESRTELLASIGLGVTDVEKKGIMLPVILSHCEYSIAAKFEQEITVRAKISSIPKSRLHIDYYVFNEPALNSFSKELSEKIDKEKNLFFIKKVIKVKVERLDKILDNNLNDIHYKI